MTTDKQHMPAIRDFTQGGIFRQLITLAMPLMAVSFIQMTYNMVDIIWIGRLGSKSVGRGNGGYADVDDAFFRAAIQSERRSFHRAVHWRQKDG